MAKVIVTWKVMPESAESDLEAVKVVVKKTIEDFDGRINGEMTEEPVAFGLKFVKVSFAYDEEKGTTDSLEEELAKDDNIQSVEVLSVGRAMG
tara:strand:- start:998 stop:1276 length:279 start_codon:yes stop_codon:yes gene_type:complete